MKKYIMLILTAILLSACSDTGGEVEAPVQNDPAEETEEEREQAPEENEASDDDLETVETLGLVSSFEDLTKNESGELTKEYSLRDETNSFAAINPLEGIEEDFMAQMQGKEEIEDPERVLEQLQALLGNGAVGALAEKLNKFKPTFSAPLLPEPEEMDAGAEGEEPPAHAMILLDASSSMLLDVDGEQKMMVAKDAVLDFGKTIGAASEVSLYVYGHEGTQEDEDRELSCSTIDEIVPMGEYNEEKFYESVNGVEAKGWTPLAEAIKKAKEDSSQYEGKLTVFIVSDGMETCGGDPIAEAEAFVEEDEDRKVNIIGFNVDEESEEQLKKVAEAGLGDYLAADTAEDLQYSMKKTWVPSDMEVINKSLSSPKNGFAVPFQNLEINDTAMDLGFALSRENARFKRGVEILKNEEVITEEIARKTVELIDSQNEVKKQLIDEKKEEKLQAIEDEVNRIDEEINEWVERMEKLKEEQG
ncbi:VWA domain-containing protein [Jeotgalibacillus proteolyticus]|uniref:VWFA domain-containing protein n=1 Tax=Jeotgalibacillus proteolyticus TaxID=2082395 RepID=A0A2S5G7W1_9BACL|nr:VWA domain-containing protein [Jeotgalibacillus proteolyticus]PPA69082.1 hypothetical protein C4B60_17365 [Jeotgalibacillus proteolyticus]